MNRAPKILAALAATSAVALAGCGDDDGDGADGPASIVPADAPAYFEIVVRPEGEAATSAEAALGNVIDSEDPGAEIAEQIESAGGPDYEQEIEPWLGERVGFYPSSLAGDAEVVLIAETTDADAAIDFLSKQEDATEETREIEGTEFRLDEDGDAFGTVDDFIVFGRPEGVEQVVKAADGDSLGGTDAFTDGSDGLREERLATLFALPKDFIEAIPEDELDAQGREIVLDALDESGDEPVLGDLTASETAATFELSVPGETQASEPSALLGSLPGDAWLGFGLANLGAAIENGLESLEQADIPGLSADTIRSQLNAQLGIDLDRDVIDALGDGALFVTGTTESTLGGALVIESADPAATGRLLNKIQGLIRRQAAGVGVRLQPLASAGGDQGFQLVGPRGTLPQPIQVVQRGDRIVIGYGAQSVGRALGGGPSLDGTPGFTAAQEAIGESGLDAFVSLAPVIKLVESAGVASDPDFQQAKQYLDSLRFIAIGSETEDDRSIARFVVGLE